MNPIIEIPKLPKLGKAIRPAKQAGPAILPDRESFDAAKKPDILTALKDVPSIEDHQTVTHELTITDNILLSLVWNNPALSDVPILDASLPEMHAGNVVEVIVNDAGSEMSMKSFLNPNTEESALVNPSEEAQLRNASSLYRMAISSSLAKSLKHPDEL
jgi:TusA-related sulfurtransferase